VKSVSTMRDLGVRLYLLDFTFCTSCAYHGITPRGMANIFFKINQLVDVINIG